MLNDKPTVINPQVPSEQPPVGTERSMSEYLSRMFRYCAQALRQIYDWQKVHLTLTPPDYTEDVHPQYWHKRNTSGYAGFYFHDLTTPKTINYNVPITDYTAKLVTDWKLTSDTTAGTITVHVGEEGVYTVGMSGFCEGTANTSYIVSVYKNGLPTLARCPIVFRGTNTAGSLSNTFIFYIEAGTYELRLEYPSGGSLGLYDIKFFMLRYLDGTSVSPPATNTTVPVSPVPPGWGQPP